MHEQFLCGNFYLPVLMMKNDQFFFFFFLLYLLKSWRVNFYVANENCRIQLPHKIALVDGILLIFTHINSKKGFRLTFRIAELRIIIWIRRTRFSMMLNTVCIKTQHQWTVFQSISNNIFLWQEHVTGTLNRVQRDHCYVRCAIVQHSMPCYSC